MARPLTGGTKVMDYRFKFQIETEDGEVINQGSTYIIPENISEYGECESVDMEVGKYLRIFKATLEKEKENNES